ncbi:hypothetical protein JCM6882_004863 [Rhodosporidiobolus microsporus]
MPPSTDEHSPTPDDFRRGSTVSNADDVFEESPSTPTPGDVQGGAEGAGGVKDSAGGTAADGDGANDSPVAAASTAPTASTSSLNLALNDAQQDLEPLAANSVEFVASLRGQITDLTSQVTSLNSKLIKAYQTRGELEDDLHEKLNSEIALKQRVAELENDKRKWAKEIEAGGWVEKTHVQGEMHALMARVVEEAESRKNAVQKHSALETEIENLTSNLFTEANKMVAFERLARARAEEKTRSVEEAGVSMQALLEDVQLGLQETMGKLDKREAEIAELKKRLAAHGEHVEEEMPEGQESADGDVGGIMFSDGEHLTPIDTKTIKPSSSAIATPSHLSAPRLLTTALPYHEFLAFITYLRQLRVTALSRPPDGPGYPHPMLQARHMTYEQAHAHGLTPAQLLAPHLLLSTHLSQPFLKRCVEEDSDPALRLDIAPGLGFLSRRSVGTAIVDGTLLIEPLHGELPSEKCSLCGCSLAMWLPNSPHRPLQRTASATNVNTATQTMRKMLPSSLFRTNSFSQNPSSSTPATSAPSSAYHSAASSVESFTFPAPVEKASHHPHDSALQVHLFRAGDNSSQRYAVCPSYCLARLRAVCEFWTYVRVIERGLLLEEGFKFGQSGKGGAGGAGKPALSRQSSFVRAHAAATAAAAAAASAPPTPMAEKSQEAAGLGLGHVGTREDEPDVQAKDFEAEDTEDGKKDGEPETPKIVEPEPADEEKKEQDAEGKDKSGSSSTESTPDLPQGAKLTENANSSSSSLSKPARPARSSARTSPAIGSNPSPPPSPKITPPSPIPPPSPSATPAPALPLRSSTPLAAPPLPSRQPSSSGAAPPFATGAGAGAPGDIIGNAVGWEDRCWSEVVRLKESVFWTRVAAISPDGSAVSNRGARVWVQ